jgi:hypothetical protein
MIWRKIDKIPFKNVNDCMKELRKQAICSEWIEDIFKRKKKISYVKYKEIEIHRVKVQQLGFKKPTTLKKIYSKFGSQYKTIPPEISIYLRLIYKKQPKGEWLRIAVDFNAMVDSDGVPHLPKLGKALGKHFIETYWSYPGAIFHPHNDFLVMKK